MIRSGEAFAIFGYLDSELVTAALFQYSGALCFYGVSASDRSFFDKPISHAVIWTAVLQAKSLGCLIFEMGEQVYAGQFCNGEPPSEKEMNIAKFKRGFGGETLSRVRILR
jgi:lipid II:glycine glycyltransferase (peptidoglycan interpeptide bridge formation enzyme)